MTHLSDQELIARFKKGDQQDTVFTALIKKHQEKLYWHIRRILIDHEDTNDVLQNTFIKMWNHLGQFREDAQLYTWLYRIATNESFSFLEQKRKKMAVPLDETLHDLSSIVAADQSFDAAKIEWKLQLAIQQLPDKQRTVFNLRYYDEMTYEEISEVLGTSVGALKASYHHAVKKIEEYILQH